MIRSVRCHNLAALAQSDDPGELVHPRPVDAGLRFRFTFQIVTKLDLRQVVCPSSRPSSQWICLVVLINQIIGIRPTEEIHQDLRRGELKEVFKGLGIKYDTYKGKRQFSEGKVTDEVDKIADHEVVFMEQTGQSGRAIIIVLVLKPEYSSEVVRCGREFLMEMRDEQVRRASLSA